MATERDHRGRTIIRGMLDLYAPTTNSCFSTPIENWTHVYMNLFTRNSPYYLFLKYILFLLKHPVHLDNCQTPSRCGSVDKEFCFWKNIEKIGEIRRVFVVLYWAHSCHVHTQVTLRFEDPSTLYTVIAVCTSWFIIHMLRFLSINFIYRVHMTLRTKKSLCTIVQ